MRKKFGSATLVIIISAIVFTLYATSTYADVRHMKNKYSEYEKSITSMFEQEYNDTADKL